MAGEVLIIIVVVVIVAAKLENRINRRRDCRLDGRFLVVGAGRRDSRESPALCICMYTGTGVHGYVHCASSRGER